MTNDSTVDTQSTVLYFASKDQTSTANTLPLDSKNIALGYLYTNFNLVIPNNLQISLTNFS